VLQEDLASAIFAQVESLSSSFCVLDEVFEVKKSKLRQLSKIYKILEIIITRFL
jgi:hypothetical protein